MEISVIFSRGRSYRQFLIRRLAARCGLWRPGGRTLVVTLVGRLGARGPGGCVHSAGGEWLVCREVSSAPRPLDVVSMLDIGSPSHALPCGLRSGRDGIFVVAAAEDASYVVVARFPLRQVCNALPCFGGAARSALTLAQPFRMLEYVAEDGFEW